jgi:hypothetical protein
MSKRRAPESSSPSKKQKQGRIDTFFGAPPPPKVTKQPVPSQSKSRQARPTAVVHDDIIDVDALDNEDGAQTIQDSLGRQSISDEISTVPAAPPPPSVPKPQTGAGAAGPSRTNTVSKPVIAEVRFPSYGSTLSTDPPFFLLDSPAWPAGTATPYSFLADALVQLTETKVSTLHRVIG